MANALYKRIEIGVLLGKARRESYNKLYCVKETLAKALKISAKKLSDIENGHCEPDLRVAAEWCKLTGHHEKWEAIKYIYRLEPLATPPIHPELNQSFPSGLMNIQEEKPEAGEALERLQQIYNKRRPGQPFDARGMVEHAKQLLDLIKASYTVLYAMERDCGLSLEEVARIWTQDAIAKGIVMPKVDVEKELAMVR
jgi:DNA-binding XRE family transcriptional regulator